MSLLSNSKMMAQSCMNISVRLAQWAQGVAKLYSLNILGNISPTTENIKIKFYTLILCSYLCKITKFYPIISNYDKVMLY